MKKSTLQKHTQIANDVMFYIFTHIDIDINIYELAKQYKINAIYLQKIFKEQFGRNIYETIRSIRLQKASNLLITNRYSTISEIAKMCGYVSHSSFIKAFQSRFGMTPKYWRKGGFKEYSLGNIDPKSVCRDEYYRLLEPTITKEKPRVSFYIRSYGYEEETIKKSWQKLFTWIHSNGIVNYTELALYHDNPAITPLPKCHYVACIATDAFQRSDKLPHFTISGGVYARFDVALQRGEMPAFIRYLYHEWLPKSGYETTTKPSFAIYHDNKYLENLERYRISFYLPIEF